MDVFDRRYKVVSPCMRFPFFSLGVSSTTPRAGRVGAPRSAAASRMKLSQQMLCRRVECAIAAHQRHAHIGKAGNLQHGSMDTRGALKRNEQSQRTCLKSDCRSHSRGARQHFCSVRLCFEVG